MPFANLPSMKAFPINPALDIGAVVADVDMTIINDGHSELSSDNLAAIVEVLNRKIPVLLISGSPYDAVYCGVATNGSLHRRVALPIKAALQKQNAVGDLHFLKIFYVSGRGVVAFDPNGNEIRSADRTDKDIDPKSLSLIFRACLCGFYAVKKNLPSENTTESHIEQIWSCAGSDEEAAALTRQLLQDELRMDVGPLEKWAFGSELAFVFHGSHAPGPAIATWAQAMLRQKGINLSPDFFWAGGTDYVKASRIRKRDIIDDALQTLRKNGMLQDGKTILSFGDSNVDDFLSLNPEPHLSIFLGSKTDARNFPSAWLALDQRGGDNPQARAFAFLLKSFLNNQWPDADDAPFSLTRYSTTRIVQKSLESPR